MAAGGAARAVALVLARRQEWRVAVTPPSGRRHPRGPQPAAATTPPGPRDTPGFPPPVAARHLPPPLVRRA
ncbi:hypothetical protein GCM10023214_09900 [Amycolatopsis dongchuanensis]|uniref:Uncharacterized protein n=1 Tax=Amycolatopsis dongchuanensis TaxID=1070866 RepID=A0ABP9Q2F4_9PSEU